MEASTVASHSVLMQGAVLMYGDVLMHGTGPTQGTDLHRSVTCCTVKIDDVNASDIEVRTGGVGRKAAVGGGLGLGGLLLMLVFSMLSGGGGGGDIGDVLGQLQQGGGVSVEGETVKGNTLEGQELFGGKMMTLLGDYWQGESDAMGFRFTEPHLVVFDSPTQTGGCGVGQPEAGPFYCPGDNKIYIDFSFYQRLEQQLGFDGDFAMAYVIAHEYGHHIQNLMGVMDRRGGGNAQSVKVELQADCLAGSWASEAKAQGRLEAGDFDEAIRAANAVGDDAIQGAGASRDTFTHGSSAEREHWFTQGFESGDPSTCRTGA